MIMDWHIFWQAVKWVLVVLAAGFIGQFGRHFAKLILERRRARGAEGARLATPDPDIEVKSEKKRLKAQAKLEKKRAKAELKRAKKGQG